jgi:PRTRC genetic system protein A
MTDKSQSAKEAFAAAFRQAVVDHRFGTEGPLVKPVTYVAAENGLFEVRMNAIGTFARKIEGVPGMGQVAAGFHPALPKIPWELFEKAISFFRAVMQRHGNAEAYIQFFWNREEGKYFAHVPEQFVSGGHVSFNRDAEMELKHVLVMEAHSHNTMGAFFSGTDNADEQGDRLFMVVGRLDRRIPQVLVRYGMAGHHDLLDIEAVFEAPVEEESKQSWLEQVQPERKPDLPGGEPFLTGGARSRWGSRTSPSSLDILGRMARQHTSEEDADTEQGVLFDESGHAV